MQITIHPATPAEARLLSAFMNDYADLLEVTTETQPAPAPAAEKPKKTRAKKEEPAPVIEDAPAPVIEEATAPAGETESAGTASTPAESSAPETASAVVVTHESLKTAFGELAQKGAEVKQAMIAAVKGLGFSSLSVVTEDRLVEVYVAMTNAAAKAGA